MKHAYYNSNVMCLASLKVVFMHPLVMSVIQSLAFNSEDKYNMTY